MGTDVGPGLQPGDLIDDKYQVDRRLGQGGMAVVYACRNVRIQRDVAIKVMHIDMSKRDEAMRRFEREATAAAHIGSINICDVLDMGRLSSGEHYIVLEHLEGESLEEIVQRDGPIEPTRAVDIVTQVLDGLGAAHEAGIIHRDLKPDNIYVARQDGSTRPLVKILDFGIAKFLELDEQQGVITNDGEVVGTPFFMAPEQITSEPVDHRADIYAVGVVAYFALTGELPFSDDDMRALLVKVVTTEPPSLAEIDPTIDPELAAMIDHAMQKLADDRPQTADELREQMTAWLAKNGIKLPRPRPSQQIDVSTDCTPRPAMANTKDGLSTTTRRDRARMLSFGALGVIGTVIIAAVMLTIARSPATPSNATTADPMRSPAATQQPAPRVSGRVAAEPSVKTETTSTPSVAASVAPSSTTGAARPALSGRLPRIDLGPAPKPAQPAPHGRKHTRDL